MQNNTGVLGVSTVTAPTILGMIIWPDLIIAFLVAAFMLLSGFYFVFKRRNSVK